MLIVSNQSMTSFLQLNSSNFPDTWLTICSQASAAAPITQETVAFFQSLDIPVYEIYGMSECSGPQTLSFDGKILCNSLIVWFVPPLLKLYLWYSPAGMCNVTIMSCVIGWWCHGNSYTALWLVNTPSGQHKAGSTGKSIPGSEIKIENPDRDGNGEICYRGRHIFMGYMHDEDTTSKTIDKGANNLKRV